MLRHSCGYALANAGAIPGLSKTGSATVRSRIRFATPS
jgi:hypothetical protein